MNKKEKNNLVKASLIAGLKLWGKPRFERCRLIIEKHANLLSVDLTQFKEETHSSGLTWGWDRDSRIIEQKISERIVEQSEAVGFEDVEECVGNSLVDDSEYVFWPDGTGFTGYMDKDNKHLSKEGLFERFLRWTDGKLYTFHTEAGITIYEMDITSVKEAIKFIKKLQKENN